MPKYYVNAAIQVNGQSVKQGDPVEMSEAEAHFLLIGGFLSLKKPAEPAKPKATKTATGDAANKEGGE